jgi:hypothetical protein
MSQVAGSLDVRRAVAREWLIDWSTLLDLYQAHYQPSTSTGFSHHVCRRECGAGFGHLSHSIVNPAPGRIYGKVWDVSPYDRAGLGFELGRQSCASCMWFTGCTLHASEGYRFTRTESANSTRSADTWWRHGQRWRIIDPTLRSVVDIW